jgi:hypothetical protein
VLLAIWLIASPFVLAYSRRPAALWDTIVVGIIVLCIAAARGANPLHWIGLNWVTGLLGVWLIISPFVLGYANETAALWNSIVSGVVLGLFALWDGAATPVGRRVTR